MNTMPTALLDNHDTTVAATVAPEDLRCGDHVAALATTVELPSFLWCCDSGTLPPDQLVCLRMSAEDAGTPMRIKAICLPFVLVKTPRSRSQIIDVRHVELVKLDRLYATLTWKAMKKRRRKNGR